MARGRRCCCCQDLFFFNNGPLTRYRTSGAYYPSITVEGYDSNDFIGGFLPTNSIFAVDNSREYIFYSKSAGGSTISINRCDFNFQNQVQLTTVANAASFSFGIICCDYENQKLYYYTNTFNGGTNKTDSTVKSLSYDGTTTTTICSDTGVDGDTRYKYGKIWKGYLYLGRETRITVSAVQHRAFNIERMDAVTGAGRVSLVTRDANPSTLSWFYNILGFDISGKRNKLVWMEAVGFTVGGDGPTYRKVVVADLDGTNEQVPAPQWDPAAVGDFGDANHIAVSEKEDAIYFISLNRAGSSATRDNSRVVKLEFDGTSKTLFTANNITNYSDSPFFAASANTTDIELGCGYEYKLSLYKGPG